MGLMIKDHINAIEQRIAHLTEQRDGLVAHLSDTINASDKYHQDLSTILTELAQAKQELRQLQATRPRQAIEAIDGYVETLDDLIKRLREYPMSITAGAGVRELASLIKVREQFLEERDWIQINYNNLLEESTHATN